MALKQIIAGQFYNSGASASPGGSSGQVQYNNAGAFGGLTGLTTSGGVLQTGTFAGNGAASAPPLTLTGTWFTGGSATTTKPQLLVEPSGTATTNWSTSGTGLGINGPSGFTGRLADMQVAAVSKLRVLSDGAIFTTQGIYSEATLGSGVRAFAIEKEGGGDARIYLTSASTIRFSSGSDATSSNDTFISRGAVGVVNVTSLSGTTQALSGAGAVNVTTLTTKLTTTGVGDALTLANGIDGQIKTIVHDVDGGSAVLTPTTKTGFTTITFTNVGESATLQYVTTRGWIILALNGAVAA